MSPQDSSSIAPGDKPRTSIYTMMLLMSLIALIIAIILLCMEMNVYEWQFKAPRI